MTDDRSFATTTRVSPQSRSRTDGFDALLADHQNSSSYYVETDGAHRPWTELSAAGKLGYIAHAAALYDVPFERFAQAVRDTLGGEPLTFREAASLRLVLHQQQELHGLEALLPPDRSSTVSTPLIDRFQELLDGQTHQPPGESEPSRDQRCYQLMMAGIPRPEGWELPTPSVPPDHSDPAALPRVARDVAALQAATYEILRREPENGRGIIGVSGPGWDHMTAATRQAVLETWINWQGVSSQDRMRLMLEQVDARHPPLEKLPGLTMAAGRAEGKALFGVGRDLSSTDHHSHSLPNDQHQERPRGGPER